MEILAIIPARGGSKGIPGKNIRALAGKPLIQYTIEAALASHSISRLVVSTDDPEIAGVSCQLGAEVPIMRPAELATDESPTADALRHMISHLQVAENYHPDAIMTLQPTSPLRTARHIDESTKLFGETPEADSLVSVVRVPHHMSPWSVMRRKADGWLEPFLTQEKHLLRRQDKPVVYARNGAAIYITRTPYLMEKGIWGGKLMSYEMTPEDSLDIDAEEDLQKAAQLLACSGDLSK